MGNRIQLLYKLGIIANMKKWFSEKKISFKTMLHSILFLLFLLLTLMFIEPEESKIRSQYHSYELNKRTIENGDIKRTDYLDSNKNITIAADL